LAPKGTHCPAYLQHLHFKTIGVGKGYFWEQVELPFFLQQNGNPLLINFCNTAPLFYSKQWVTIHDLAFMHHPEWFSKSFAQVYRFMIPRIAKRSQKVITVSQTIAEQIQQTIGVRADVLYNGIAQYLVTQRASNTDTPKKIILTVSSINPRKNLSGLIAAFDQSGLTNYELVVVGAKQSVFKKEQQAYHQRVVYAGYLTNEELVQLYKQASLFVSLSFDEGFGIPVWEALYSGCPVLLSDIPVYKECFAEEALFCSPINTSEASQALARSVAQPRKTRLPQWMLDTYNYPHTAKKLMQWVDDAVKNQ
jgi:glycosyltransferase involved in cell wall biosynthesis